MSISSEIWEVLESTSKNNFNFLKKQIYTQKKEISNCQKCQFNWTRIAISQVSYILQELSDTTNLGGPTPLLIWAFRIIGICKTYCNQISIWT